jgi:hypothetical protein
VQSTGLWKNIGAGNLARARRWTEDRFMQERESAMMFPDINNDKQSTALRQAAERSHAADNPRSEYARATWRPMPQARESFSYGSAEKMTPCHGSSAGRHLVSR